MFKIEQPYAFFALLAGACAGSHTDQVQDAHMKQVEETADARMEQVDKQADQHKEAVDQTYDAHRDAAGSDQSAKAVELSKDRADYQTEAQTKLNKIAVHIQEAQQKLTVLGAHAPTQLRTDAQVAADEHHFLQQSLSNLAQVQPQSWESNKKQLDQRISELQARVGKLSDEVDDVKS